MSTVPPSTLTSRSPLLWQYANRENIRRNVTGDLRGSDGPLDTCNRIPFTFDASKLSTSFHGGGNAELRKKAAPHYGVKPEEMLFINGGCSQANHHVVHALATKGDVIIVEHPVYDPLVESSKATGSSIVPLNRLPEEEFQIPSERFEELLKSHEPRLIVVSNLHNPSCVALENLEEMLHILEKFNEGRSRPCYLVVDEVYRDLATVKIPTAASLSPYAITTFGLSKSYGLSGLRHGLILASAPVIDVILGYYTIVGVCNSSLSESLWSQFYDHRDRVLKENRETQKRRQRKVESALKSNGIPFFHPDGGTCLLVKLPTENDTDFVLQMMDKYDSAVNPGTNFGIKGHARLGYMNISEEVLDKGLADFCTHYKSYQQ
eukprot:TRINITY_DN9520_c0_g1_i2.p2 TRINITY_DN9520_c0_g1~~TRINITY_DN9520_c0_g1_i2.p2  ORF type:complete len:377 (-),score=106.01 TRINITY_DN9520_c0_g1_i2:45-1175(-)